MDTEELGQGPESTLPTDADLSQSPEAPDEETQEDLGTASGAAPIDPEASYLFGDKVVTGKEILAGTLMQDDYTRKTQELAEQRDFYQSFVDNLESPEGINHILEVVAQEAGRRGNWAEQQRIQSLLQGQAPSGTFSQPRNSSAPPFDPDVADPDVVAVWGAMQPIQAQVASIAQAMGALQAFFPALQQIATQHQQESALSETRQYVPDVTPEELKAALALVPGDAAPALKVMQYRQLVKPGAKPAPKPVTAKGGRPAQINPGAGDPAFADQVLDKIEAMLTGG